MLERLQCSRETRLDLIRNFRKCKRFRVEIRSADGTANRLIPPPHKSHSGPGVK